MFWKRTKKSREKSAPFFSIVKYLTISSTVSSFLILLLSISFLYWTLKDNLEKKSASFLNGELSEMQLVLSGKTYDWATIEKEIEGDEIMGEKFTKVCSRILDEKHRVLIETTGMDKRIPFSVFPEPVNIDPSGRGKKWQSKIGQSFLLMSAWAEPKSLKKNKYILQMAVDISQDEIILDDYRNKILLVLLLGIILLVGINIAVIKRGIRPVKDLTDKIHQITASQLHERIHAEDWPKELNVLATAFDEMLNRLEDSFSRLSQFSVNLAHELRTPINNLVGEAQVALSQTRTSEEYRQILESSLEEYSRLARMIDNLLFLARSENKEIKLAIVSLDVRKEIEAVIEFYEAVAQEAGVKVFCEGNAIFKADPILFRRLINNLLANALQYTPRGGVVTIAIQRPEEFFSIVVKDTGMGINSIDLPQIFNRFFRAPSARLKYPQGMGLGLYIVKSIMSLHGGTVSLQSLPSKGTIVTLKFPQNYITEM